MNVNDCLEITKEVLGDFLSEELTDTIMVTIEFALLDRKLDTLTERLHRLNRELADPETASYMRKSLEDEKNCITKAINTVEVMLRDKLKTAAEDKA